VVNGFCRNKMQLYIIIFQYCTAEKNRYSNITHVLQQCNIIYYVLIYLIAVLKKKKHLVRYIIISVVLTVLKIVQYVTYIVIFGLCSRPSDGNIYPSLAGKLQCIVHTRHIIIIYVSWYIILYIHIWHSFIFV